jgi:hypothetical protein
VTSGIRVSPLWDSFDRKGFRCENAIRYRKIWGLEDFTMESFTDTRGLADSLGSGHYYLQAVVRPNGILVRIPAGEVDLKQ